jgi:hypothetical protein
MKTVVHTSRFSLLGSCSGSVRRSPFLFAVPCSKFRFASRPVPLLVRVQVGFGSVSKVMSRERVA